MTAIFALALLTQEIPQKYVDAAAAIELPGDLDTWRGKGTAYAKAVDVVVDRKLWAQGLMRIDEKLGLFVDKPRIQVVLEETDEPRPAKGKGAKGIGEVRFNLRKLAEYIRRLEQFDEMESKGKDVRFKVPPTPVSALVHHELTHCFAGQYDELWLTEGLATWVAGETAHLWDFQHRQAKLEAVDAPDRSERDQYARGYCAMAWLSDRYGADALKKLVARIVADRTAVKKAFEEAAAKGWDALVADELAWSREFLKRYTPD